MARWQATLTSNKKLSVNLETDTRVDSDAYTKVSRTSPTLTRALSESSSRVFSETSSGRTLLEVVKQRGDAKVVTSIIYGSSLPIHASRIASAL